jgi:hypothetical protein
VCEDSDGQKIEATINWNKWRNIDKIFQTVEKVLEVKRAFDKRIGKTEVRGDNRQEERR